ncbi:MAG: hypothetical protein ABH808_00160 [Candidatus Kuenenbacteria bacterium]
MNKNKNLKVLSIIFCILILLLIVSFTPLSARTVKMLKTISTDVFKIFGSLVVEKDVEIKGNVGIGTATPTKKLEVDGNVKIKGVLQLTRECNLTDQDSGNSYITSICTAEDGVYGCWQYDQAGNYDGECTKLITSPGLNCIKTDQVSGNSYTTSMCTAEDGVYGCWQYDQADNYDGKCTKLSN